MPGSVIGGRVRTDRGAPVAEAQVYIAHSPVDVPDIAALTDDDGRFSLAAPVPGAYRVECFAAGLGRGGVSVQVVEGEPLHQIEITIAATRDDPPRVG